MKNILVLGYSEESTISHFVGYLKKQKIDYDFLDLSLLHSLDAFEIHQSINELTIKWGDDVFDFNTYKSFYCRHYVTETKDKVIDQYLLDLITSISSYLEFRDGIVVNRPSAGGSNGNKFIHIQLLESCGFKVPLTYLVGSQKAAKSVIDKGVILVSKSNSGIKTESVLLDESLQERIHLIDFCPSCFQEKKEGTDVRVHMVGDEAIALEIKTDSKHIDYRFSKTKKISYKEVKVPDNILKSCKLFCKKERLDFCGLDFKVHNNEWYILEANPMPGYNYFDSKLNYKISKALVKYLSKKNEKKSNNELSDVEMFISKDRRPQFPDVL